MQSHGFWIADGPPGVGKPINGMGFNATARDYARIGLMMLNGGVANGRRLLPESWVAESTTASAATEPVAPGASQEEVFAAYRTDIDRLVAERGFRSVDVASIGPDNPKRDEMRAKFLDEHFHKEDEVRFFVAGSGLFTLHVDGKVYEMLCTQGDLIAVPDSTKHWFDMGPEPSFVAIRFFTEPDGWVGHFTGTDIAQRFPRYE